MPTIEVNKKDLEKLIGKSIPDNKLEEYLMYVKGELEKKEKNVLSVEVKETNRPDLWSTEGIARELRAKLGKEKGLPKYIVKKGNVEVTVNKNLEKIRPLIACAIARNVKVDAEFITQIVQLQEKMNTTFGRKRKEVGTGLYDFDKMHPNIEYKGFKDKDVKFVPLDMQVEMHPSEIVKKHDKGKQFASLVEGKKYYPIVIDAEKQVCAMPPIINSDDTGKITSKTKNIFIEATGFNWEMVSIALQVTCMALADRGATIESVHVKMPKGKAYPKSTHTPKYGEKHITIDVEKVRKVTGLDLKDKEWEALLNRARYEVRKKNGKEWSITYPDYRNDVLHAMDVVEDVLIAYGYNNIESESIDMQVKGFELPEVQKEANVREACTGLTLQEIMQYTMTSKEKQETFMELKNEAFVELSNPMSSNYAVFRKRLIPEMLAFFAKNKHAAYPQTLFEIGKTLELNAKEETQVKECNKVCIALTKNEANFSEISSYLASIAKPLGWKYSLKEITHPSFIPGRVAEITLGKRKGIIGEIHPQVLLNFGLEMPVAVFEIEL